MCVLKDCIYSYGFSYVVLPIKVDLLWKLDEFKVKCDKVEHLILESKISSNDMKQLKPIQEELLTLYTYVRVWILL